MTFAGNVGNANYKVANGKKILEFSIACDASYRDANGQKVEQTDWMTVVIFGERAEKLQSYVTKGKGIYVEGRLKTHSWEKDGHRFYKSQIEQVQVLQFTDKKPSDGSYQRPAAPVEPKQRQQQLPPAPAPVMHGDFNDDDMGFMDDVFPPEIDDDLPV